MGGSKHKKNKNSNSKTRRTLVYPDNKDTLFAYVLNALGDCRFLVKCSDETERVGTVRGSLYKNTYINSGDLVLIGLRDFGTTKTCQKEVCDILMKYTLDELQEIRSSKLLVYKGSDRVFIHNVDLNKSRGLVADDYDSEEAEERDNIFRPNVSTSEKQSNVKIIRPVEDNAKEDDSESDSDSDSDEIDIDAL